MKKKNAQVNKASSMNKFNVSDMANQNVEDLANALMAEIDSNNANWIKGWINVGPSLDFRNYISNKSYSGGYNLFVLFIDTLLKPELVGEKRSGYFVTQKQAFDMGWTLKDEVKNYSNDNQKRREELKKITEKMKGLAKDSDERKELDKQRNDLILEIRKHQIWNEIVFYSPSYYRNIEEDGKYYTESLIVERNVIIGVKSRREITKEHYENDAAAKEKVNCKYTARYYKIAAIEWYNRDNKEIKNRVIEPPKFSEFNKDNLEEYPLYKMLESYTKFEKINVKLLSQDRAYYSLTKDEITLPELKQFTSIPSFLETYAHECAHSTGSKNRLKRFEEFIEGPEQYSAEEMVAETTALFTFIEYQLLTDENLNSFLAYIKGYMKRCQEEDKKTGLFAAVNAALRAKNFMQNPSNKQDEEVVQEEDEETE